MSGESIVWWLMAALAVAAAAGMITSKNPIHSAMWLVVNFLGLALIYLLLSAPLLFAVQLIVYAGAIMVLFLFVVMFFMSPRARQYLRPPLRLQMVFGGILGILLLMLLCFGFFSGGAAIGFGDLKINAGQQDNGALERLYGTTGEEVPLEQLPLGHPRAIGAWMFSYHVLPFTTTSLVLLAALLGALMVARDEVEEGIGNFVRTAAIASTGLRRRMLPGTAKGRAAVDPAASEVQP